MLDERLTYFAQQLACVPNAPYLPNAIVARVERLLHELNEVFHDSIQVTRNHLGVFARVISGTATHPILVSAHLDHPLFITRAENEAVPFGLISTAQIDVSLGCDEWSIPVTLYDSRGSELGSAELRRTTGTRFPKVNASFSIPKNCHVLWRLPLRIDNEFVSLIAADNLINCALSLAALERVLATTDVEYDITFMFGAIEEIKQLSATGVILEGIPSIGKIKSEWIIFILEVGPTTMKDSLLTACKKYNLPFPRDDGGPALRISDDWMLHGQENVGPNLAEHILLRSITKIGGSYQHSISGGMCDGSVFTSFSVTPSIAGIAFANPFRHNVSNDDFPVYEQVRVSDVNLGLSWLAHALINADHYAKETADTELLLTHKLRSTELKASPKQIERINIDRKATYLAMRPRMRSGHYFPESILERIKFWFWIGYALAYQAGSSISLWGKRP